MKKTNWKKASGEVIGFSIALLFLIGFFSQIIGTCVYVAHKEELNEAVMRIGRGIVTEDSMDKAQEKAEKAMKAYMGDREYMPLDECHGHISGEKILKEPELALLFCRKYITLFTDTFMR